MATLLDENNIVMNRIMNTRSELQYKAVADYNEAVFFLFQATILCNGSWHGFTPGP